MTRSQFLLACSLLIVAGTLAFTVTFHRQERTSISSSPEPEARPSLSSKVATRPTTLPPVGSDRTHFEVTVSETKQSEGAGIIERETRQKLEEMSERYQLTGNQRRQIYPLLARYHSRFEEGMIVNGLALSPPTPDEQLSDEIYPLLEGLQQESYLEDVLADDQWWGEIVTQLRDDLDQALESGDMIPTTNGPPARGDGSLIEESGGGLYLDQ